MQPSLPHEPDVGAPTGTASNPEPRAHSAATDDSLKVEDVGGALDDEDAELGPAKRAAIQSPDAGPHVPSDQAQFRRQRSTRLSVVSKHSNAPPRRNTVPHIVRATHWALPPWVIFYASAALLIGLLYLSLCFLLDGNILPHGPMWAAFLIWLCAHVGATLCSAVRLPKLLGMLVAGILLQNIPGDPVQGLPHAWGTTIRGMGLSMILTRSGLELDVAAFLSVGIMAARLTALPGVCEALAVSAIVIPLFGMPYALGLSLGFILGAVSPAVVVVGMFDLQKKGYGVAKGIPSLVVAAASFDDVLAITGFSLAIGLAVPQGNLAWELMHGPLNVVFGLVAGLVGTALCSFTLLWNTRLARSMVVLLVSQCMMLGALRFHFSGAGALGGLMLGVGCNWVWRKGLPRPLALGPDAHYATDTEHDLEKLWGLFAQPLLFGVIGTAVEFRTMEASVVPKALLVLAVGVGVRLLMAYLAVLGGKLGMKERLFIALSWIPKATVQAALASVPADLIAEFKAGDKEYKAWGQAIITIAVFSIILTAPIGLIIINTLGPRWLSHDEVYAVQNPEPYANAPQAGAAADVPEKPEKEDPQVVMQVHKHHGSKTILHSPRQSPAGDAVVEVDDYELKSMLMALADRLEQGVSDILDPSAAARHIESCELLKQGIGRMEVKREDAPAMDTAGAFFQMSRRCQTPEGTPWRAALKSDEPTPPSAASGPLFGPRVHSQIAPE